jgi:hypothetical protein
MSYLLVVLSMVLRFPKGLVRTLEATISRIGNQHGHFGAGWQGRSNQIPTIACAMAMMRPSHTCLKSRTIIADRLQFQLTLEQVAD